MLKKNIIILCFFLKITSLYSAVENGTIDLKNYNFSNNEPINLSGNWLLIHDSGEVSYSSVPGGWTSNKGKVEYQLTIFGSDQENLVLAMPQVNTKYKLYQNSELIAQDEQNRTRFIPIKLYNGKNIFKFEIENYTEIYGGLRNSPYIGSFNKIIKKHEINILRDTLISGASFIMFLFFFILFLNYKNDKSTLYFSLICLFLTIRGLVTNDKIIFNYLPNLSYLFLNKLEYISLYVLPLLTLLFIESYFERKILKKFDRTLINIGFIYFLTSVLFPPKIYISILFTLYVYVIISSVFIIGKLIYFAYKKEVDSIKILISIISLLLAGIFDSINVIYITSEVNVLPSSMIIFIMFMSFIVSQREIRKLNKINKLSKENIKVIKYLSKFVPNAFIKTVGMGNITTLKRGEGVEKVMTVVFTNIINFKNELKLHKAESTIDLLNKYYTIISPIISSHGGFIDKFIDETVMALFPGKPDDAIDAVLEINRQIEKYNNYISIYKPLKMRTSIHLGSQYIGIVGDHNRVDATVISNVVNTASRINSFASKIERDILISKDVYYKLENRDKYKTMFMGNIKLKGKQSYIGIYSVYQNIVSEADKLFGMAMIKLENNYLEKIEDVLLNIKRKYPNHKPSNYYLNLIENNKLLEDITK